MGIKTEFDPRGMRSALLGSHGVVIFLVLFSCWSLYRVVKRAPTRFHVPHDFVMQHVVFGRAGWAIDVFCYIALVLLLIAMVRSTRDKVEIALFIGWVGPVVINPLRMAIPKYTSRIWWVEICLQTVFILASIIVLLRVMRKTPDRRHPGLPDSRYLTGIRAKASPDRQAQVITNRKSSILGRFSTRTNTRCPKRLRFILPSNDLMSANIGSIRAL
jgi:hypothetical protein